MARFGCAFGIFYSISVKDYNKRYSGDCIMKKLIRIFLWSAGLLAVASVAMFITFKVISGMDSDGTPNIGNFTQEAVQESDIIVEPYAALETASENDEDAVRINKNTKIIYEYVYPDNEHAQSEEASPYFLIGLTEKELTEIYYGWDITVFTEDSVIMRKQLKAGSERYIVGIKDGYVAVFYDGVQKSDNVKEVTATPINALTPDEQIKLKEGVYVSGRDNLIKILEDYGS